MPKTTDAKQLLKRAAIRRALGKNAKERRRAALRLDDLYDRMIALVRDGQEAGLSISQMARDAGTNRAIIRQRIEGRGPQLSESRTYDHRRGKGSAG